MKAILLDVLGLLVWLAIGMAILGTWFESFGGGNETVRKAKALKAANKK